MGRDGVDALLASRAEKLQGRTVVHLGVVEFGDGRRAHDVAVLDLDRIIVAGGDTAEHGDILVKFDVHDPVFLQSVHGPGFGFARLHEAQRFGDGHLIDENLAGFEWRFRDAVPGLDDCRIFCGGGRGYLRRPGEKGADGDGVGRVVGTLVDDFQDVVRADDAGRELDAARAPAIGQGHLAAAEGDLIAGDGHGLQNGAADHALGLLIQVGIVVSGQG